jgi:hypothetical protein
VSCGPSTGLGGPPLQRWWPGGPPLQRWGSESAAEFVSLSNEGMRKALDLSSRAAYKLHRSIWSPSGARATMRLLPRFLQRPLDLDADMPRQGEMADISAIEGRPVPRQTVWRLMKLILSQALVDGARVVRLCCDSQADSFRMYYCLSGEGGDSWYEMVAPPNDAARRMIALMRGRCGLRHGRERGLLCYRRGDKVHRANCVSADSRNLEVHFS